MKLKKLACLAISAAMVLSLGACQDAAATANDTKNTDSTASATDGATFKIGAIGPLTGSAANYGQAVVWGAQQAVDEINAAGGINGYQVEYKYEDDELDNEKSVNAYNTLKDWGAQMLVGSTTSSCSIAVSEKTKEDSI